MTNDHVPATQHQVDQVLAELRQLRALRTDLPDLVAAAVAEALRAERLELDDRDPVIDLLPMIEEHVGGRTFSVRELMEHAELPAAFRMRDAIGRVVAGKEHAGRTLGQALLRASRADNPTGLTVIRHWDDRIGAIWEVRRAPGE